MMTLHTAHTGEEEMVELGQERQSKMNIFMNIDLILLQRDQFVLITLMQGGPKFRNTY